MPTSKVKLSGVALREPHYEHFLREAPLFPATEVIFENYIYTEGERLEVLQEVAKKYFVHLHGVSSNIGSFDPLNQVHFAKLKKLSELVGASLLSDHLCFTRQGGHSSFELLPVPRTELLITHIGERVDQVRQWLGKDFLLENISSYFTYRMDQMSELEFMSRLADKHQVRFLFDVNNLYVNSVNFGFDPHLFIQRFPKEAVGAFHVGGHEDLGLFLFDTHGADLKDPVISLYREAIKHFGFHSTFLERDENIPENISHLNFELKKLLESADA